MDELLSHEALLVKNALIERGLETPLIENKLSAEQKIQLITEHMQAIMSTLGLDLSDDSLEQTPSRVARMFINEFFSGLDYANFPKITLIDNKMKCDEMIKVTNINVTSTCEHHFVVICLFVIRIRQIRVKQYKRTCKINNASYGSGG